MDGSLLIVDFKKCDKGCFKDATVHSPNSPQERLKVTARKSKDIVRALEELGTMDIAVNGDYNFLFDAKHEA